MWLNSGGNPNPNYVYSFSTILLFFPVTQYTLGHGLKFELYFGLDEVFLLLRAEFPTWDHFYNELIGQDAN